MDWKLGRASMVLHIREMPTRARPYFWYHIQDSWSNFVKTFSPFKPNQHIQKYTLCFHSSHTHTLSHSQSPRESLYSDPSSEFYSTDEAPSSFYTQKGAYKTRLEWFHNTALSAFETAERSLDPGSRSVFIFVFFSRIQNLFYFSERLGIRPISDQIWTTI